MSAVEDEKRPSVESVRDHEKHATSEEVAALEAAALPEFDDPNLDKDAAIAGILEDDSPYPEVRSAVANTDDPTIAVGTLRAWVLGVVIPYFVSYTKPTVAEPISAVEQRIVRVV
ncbi:OPT oligopeptide transporter [Mycena kentingensis (nom. inval.)]|nr:OPT oligopeptide transporter [Mycena kentingensis (nom. inval.)]